MLIQSWLLGCFVSTWSTALLTIIPTVFTLRYKISTCLLIANRLKKLHYFQDLVSLLNLCLSTYTMPTHCRRTLATPITPVVAGFTMSCTLLLLIPLFMKSYCHLLMFCYCNCGVLAPNWYIILCTVAYPVHDLNPDDMVQACTMSSNYIEGLKSITLTVSIYTR